MHEFNSHFNYSNFWILKPHILWITKYNIIWYCTWEKCYVFVILYNSKPFSYLFYIIILVIYPNSNNYICCGSAFYKNYYLIMDWTRVHHFSCQAVPRYKLFGVQYRRLEPYNMRNNMLTLGLRVKLAAAGVVGTRCVNCGVRER